MIINKRYLVSILSIILGLIIVISSGYDPPVYGETVHNSKVTIHIIQGRKKISNPKTLTPKMQVLPKTGDCSENYEKLGLLFIIIGFTLVFMKFLKYYYNPKFINK